MAPPPSQRGKFRPKKPQKKTTKVAAPAEASSSAPPAAAPTEPGAVASQRNTAPIVEANRGGGRGRGGRGRGGRGGRGRGRIPIPQGTVFFTGGEKKTAASAKGSSSSKTSITPGTSQSKTASKSKYGKSPNDVSTEEVVGQLETAIGGTGRAKKNSILERDSGRDYEDDDGPMENVSEAINLNLTAGCLYDSDSSDDRSTRKPRNFTPMISPLELPFPEKPLPIGVGSLSRRESYDVPTVGKPDSANSTMIDFNDNTNDSKSASPFVALHKANDVAEENNSWFLVQLPTRLPPMQKNFTSSETGTVEDDEMGNAEDNENVADSAPSSSDVNNAMNNISEVIVPPVTTGSFDNGLDKIAAGRIGKMLVYKSGKTVLVMDGPDGKKVTMDVNEGLTCSFHQQAVAVNVEEGSYVTLGNVNKSVVITPDLSCI
jgi:hypothetical protein